MFTVVSVNEIIYRPRRVARETSHVSTQMARCRRVITNAMVKGQHRTVSCWRLEDGVEGWDNN